ncbi:MAG: amino acid aminotransferase [Gammaproteobacteria bacterium]|nr:aspartate/tyrosine/aromatic aminotransferase [Pseudomonadales bacterium]MCP5346476.1 aspartate/tyrosine/aromatic aminotransferase [Pseudomonadales bacterium]
MFETLQSLNADPILGLMAAFRADCNPAKIDLGVGVYKDSRGRTPVMAAVKEAETRLLETQDSKSYVGPAGDADYDELTARLVLGDALCQQLQERRCTVQVPGGCGGLRVAAEFIMKANPRARIWVSDPTWPNHVPLLGTAGLQIETYPYYDYDNHVIRFEEMLAALQSANANDLLLLHGCCHNPCGADLSADQWQAVRDLALDKGLTVFIDLAYQGLGDGLEEDVYGVRLLAASLPELLVVSSCSKNFGLYRERVGALTVICQSGAQRAAVSSQLASIARGIYSMPPDHGAAIVRIILEDQDLRLSWDRELTEMRDRINGLRATLSSRLAAAGVPDDFSFIRNEKGMFSFLGIGIPQVQRLIGDYSIYLVDSSRINVAGINDSNIDYLVDSLIKVLQQ